MLDEEVRLPKFYCSIMEDEATVAAEVQGVRKNVCVVCRDLAYGMHFGVLTCRACAAFFRRSVAKKREYTCVNGSNNCVITKGKETVVKCSPLFSGKWP